MPPLPIDLPILSWGDGPGRLLLLHGISSTAAGWWRLGPDLAADGWSVIAPHLRGHGTAADPGTYRLAEHAADVLALGQGWDAVLGHSMGGAIAVLASSSRPSWTRGLILQDPALVMEPDADEVIGWLLAEHDTDATTQAVAAANPRWHPHDAALKAEALRTSSPAMVEATIRGNRPWNLVSEAATIPVPMVLLGSDPVAGGIMPVALGEWLMAQGARIDYRMIPGAGHSTHREVDMYETYLGEVRSALRRLPTLGTSSEGRG